MAKSNPISLAALLNSRKRASYQISELCKRVNACDASISNHLWTPELCYKTISLVLKAKGKGVKEKWFNFLLSDAHPYNQLRFELQTLLFEILDKVESDPGDNSCRAQAKCELKKALTEKAFSQKVLKNDVQRALTGEQLLNLAVLDRSGETLPYLFNYSFSLWDVIADFFRFILGVPTHPVRRFRAYWSDLPERASVSYVVKLISALRFDFKETCIEYFKSALAKMLKRPLKYIREHAMLWDVEWNGKSRDVLSKQLIEAIVKIQVSGKLLSIFKDENIVDKIFMNVRRPISPDELCSVIINAKSEKLNKVIFGYEKLKDLFQGASFKKLSAVQKVLKKSEKLHGLVKNIIDSRKQQLDKTPAEKLKIIVECCKGEAGFRARLPEGFLGQKPNDLEKQLMDILDGDNAEEKQELRVSFEKLMMDPYRLAEFIVTFPVLWKSVKDQYLNRAPTQQEKEVFNRGVEQWNENLSEFKQFTFTPETKWAKAIQASFQDMVSDYSDEAYQDFFRALDGVELIIGGHNLGVNSFASGSGQLPNRALISKALFALGADLACLRVMLINASQERWLAVPSVRVCRVLGVLHKSGVESPQVSNRVEIKMHEGGVLYRQYRSHSRRESESSQKVLPQFCIVTEITITPSKKKNEKPVVMFMNKILFKSAKTFKEDYEQYFSEVVKSEQFKKWLREENKQGVSTKISSPTTSGNRNGFHSSVPMHTGSEPQETGSFVGKQPQVVR